MLAGMLSAQVYYAKVEPLFRYTIAASTSGEITLADETREGGVSDQTIIRIDDALDKVNYEIAQESYRNLREIYETKHSVYEKIAAMSTKSQIEKDNEKISLLTAKNTMENARLTMETIKDRLAKKSINAAGLYVYDIFVNEGEYVNPGTKLAELHDISGSRITVFVNKEEINNIKDSTISVNGKMGIYRIDKKLEVADSEFISSYRVELVGPAPKRFSDIAKIEIILNKEEQQ